MRFILAASFIFLELAQTVAWASPQNPTCAERRPRCMGCWEDWDSGVFKGSWCPQRIVVPDEKAPTTELRLHDLSPAQKQAIEKMLETTQ